MKVSSNIPYICPSCRALKLVEKSVHEDYFIYSECDCKTPMKPLSSFLGSYLIWDFNATEYRLNYRKLSFLKNKKEDKLTKAELHLIEEAKTAISTVKDYNFVLASEIEMALSYETPTKNQQINLL